MNKSFMTFLENTVMPVAGRFAAERHIRALRDGLAVTMPLIIIGSVFMILANFPLPGYADFVNGIFGAGFTNKLLYPIRVTFDIVAILAVISISYQLARDKDVDGLSAGAIALAAFLMLNPVETINAVLANGDTLNLGRVLPTANLSAGGLIVAILTAIAATDIFIYIVKKNWVVDMPESVPPAVAKSFTAITPGFVILVLFFFIRLGFEATSYHTAFVFITKFVGAPLALVGLSYGGMFTTVSLYSFFWTLGIHGTRVVFGVMDSVLLPAMDQNRIAFEAGQQLPNIVTLQFYDNFVNSLGGCGATLGLIICIFLMAKSKQAKSIGKLALAPAIFNISEPIIFGIPIVMNPIMMVPFILAPLAVGSLTYICMAIGLVSCPVGIAVPWTVPSLFSGFLTTNGDWRAVILQIINILVSALIYWPFLKAWDNRMVRQEATENDIEE